MKIEKPILPKTGYKIVAFSYGDFVPDGSVFMNVEHSSRSICQQVYSNTEYIFAVPVKHLKQYYNKGEKKWKLSVITI